eukprot:gene3540-4043_t
MHSQCSLNNSYVPESSDWTTIEKSLATTILIIIDTCALFANILIIATIVLTKSLRQRPEISLVANLAVSDLFVALLIIPYSVDVLLYDQLRLGNWSEEFIGFLNFLLCIASIVNLTVLALDQYLCIKWPFRFEISRPTSSKYAVIYVWLHSACCGIPPYFGVNSYSCFIPNIGYCTEQQWSEESNSVVFSVIVIVFSWGASFLVLIFAYANIFMVLRRQRKAISSTMVHRRDCPINKATLTAATELNSVPIGAASQNEAGSSVQQNVDGNDVSVATPARRVSRKRCSCLPDTKPATSLFIIVLVYLVSWTPFCVMLLVEIATERKEYHICHSCFYGLAIRAAC